MFCRKFFHLLLAFLMLGGASLFLMVFFLLLRIPSLLMLNEVRSLLQFFSGTLLTFILLFSYSHFVWSYKFAYQQGSAFIARHRFRLLAAPLMLFCLLVLCALSWSYPVDNLPFLKTLDGNLCKFGLNLHWSAYGGCGQLLLANLFVCQTIMAVQHYCMQAYGVALTCGEDEGFKLIPEQKKIFRFNLYALAAMNLFSGYTFFAFFNTSTFVYHPVQFPALFTPMALVIFTASTIALLLQVILPIHRQQKRLPPLLAAVPVISVWIWLQPFCQPFGFQAWVVPLAHGAQQIYFAYKVENRNFDPFMKNVNDDRKRVRYLYLFCLSVIIVVLGYAIFIYFPVQLDRKVLIGGSNGNFFLLAAFIFISLHHYLVDGVIWKHDSRARQLLTSGENRLQ